MADQNQKPNVPDWLKSLFVRNDLVSARDEPEPGRKGFVITLCILTACLLWFAFSMQETYLQMIEMPVEVTDLPEGRALLSLPPDHVRVQVEGEGVQLLRLYYNPPTIPVAVSTDTESQDMQLIVSEEVSSVSIQSVMPRTISMPTDDQMSRRIPIRSRIAVRTAPAHFIVGDVVIRPDSVTVTGAERIVSGLDSWPTERLVMPDVGDTVRTTVPLADSLGGLLHFDTPTVEFYANVQEFTEGSRSLQVRVTDAPPNRRVSLDPSSVTVRYRIPLSQFDEAAASEAFVAFVAYDQIRTDTSGVLYPQLDWPDNLNVREPRITPDALRYYNVLGAN
ncbi:MAG: hypothetical protein HKN17_08620 [Rhodothermales bacterium]|nr:hypothetical protein [Rhodothermales bacterium]